MGVVVELADPQCPSCLSVLDVVEAPATFHEWWCQRCDLMFSTTSSYAVTDPEWAARAQRRHRDALNAPRPPATDIARELEARARAIAAGRPPRWRGQRSRYRRERSTA